MGKCVREDERVPGLREEERESDERSQGRWNCDLLPGNGTPIQFKDV